MDNQETTPRNVTFNNNGLNSIYQRLSQKLLFMILINSIHLNSKYYYLGDSEYMLLFQH